MNTRLLTVTRQGHYRADGFTLIELMITVAIVAILAAIAYPNYRNYVIRGQLVDATNGLAAMRANMERYYQDNRSYGPINGFNPPCMTPVPSGGFTISCPTTPTTTLFSLQAVGTAAGSVLSGFMFTVDQNDNMATTVTSPPVPTAFQGCSNAWVTKTGGC